MVIKISQCYAGGLSLGVHFKNIRNINHFLLYVQFCGNFFIKKYARILNNKLIYR